MEKRVEPLKINTTTDGMIDLIQGDSFRDEEASVIRIHPYQVEQVIKCLKEAKAELKGVTGTVKQVKLTGV